MKKLSNQDSGVPAASEHQEAVLSVLGEIKSYQKLVYENEDTGEVSDKPLPGYLPIKVSKFIYVKGHPVQFQVDLKDRLWGEVDTPKENFRPTKELQFVVLGIVNMGKVLMYSKSDEFGQVMGTKRNTISVVAYIPDMTKIVSFILPTWSATNLLREYEKPGRTSPAGEEIADKKRLLFTAFDKQVENGNKTMVWTLDFKVSILPPKKYRELAQFAADAGKFYSIEHIAEAMSRPENNFSLVSPPAWLRSLCNGMSPEEIGAINDAINTRKEARTGYAEEPDTEESTAWEYAEPVSDKPEPVIEVPLDSFVRYNEAYDANVMFMTDEQKDMFLIKRDISLADFKTKGKALQSLIAELNKVPF